MKKPIKLPNFKNENEEHKFWSKLDLTDYLDAGDLKPVAFPGLKPTTRRIEPVPVEPVRKSRGFLKGIEPNFDRESDRL